ncbi:MAG: transketolase [Ignavibacteria bacterium]
MNKNNFIQSLQEAATNIRENLIRMSLKGGTFLASSLSCVDILIYLYKRFLKIDIHSLNSFERDYFLLSKGHVAPALYATLAETGIILPERLNNYLKPHDYLYWHPNPNVQGVEFHSGSLGHLLSVGIGIAIDCKLRNHHNKVVVMMGDGELNEGSVWEAILVASSKELDNIVVIIDRNKYQASSATENLIKLEPLVDKFKSFGCGVRVTNGNDFVLLDKAMSRIPILRNKPSVIICETKRAYGIPSLMKNPQLWFRKLNEDEANALLQELRSFTPE